MTPETQEDSGGDPWEVAVSLVSTGIASNQPDHYGAEPCLKRLLNELLRNVTMLKYVRPSEWRWESKVWQQKWAKPNHNAVGDPPTVSERKMLGMWTTGLHWLALTSKISSLSLEIAST